MNGRPGFIIRAVAQPAQGLYFNDSELQFFQFLQCDVRIKSMGGSSGITKAVKRCHAKYPAGKMAACWWSLVTSYRGCLETGGDSNYKAHCGVRKVVHWHHCTRRPEPAAGTPPAPGHAWG